MFVMGLLVGPILGMLGGDFLLRSDGRNLARNTVVIALVLVGVLFAPSLQLELKSGLTIGLTLGLLLSATPDSLFIAGQDSKDR